MWTRLFLTPEVSGCPNRCRHCCESGSPPYGALMTLDQLKWAVEEFRRMWESVADSPIIWVWPDWGEPTAHPQFLEFMRYWRSFIPPQYLDSGYHILSTNGFGIARWDDWRTMFESLKAMGLNEITLVVHGLESVHDWFVAREGAFRDIEIAARRALDSEVGVNFIIFLNQRNVSSLAAIYDRLKVLARGQAKINIEVPCFFMNDRLWKFESIRPTKTEVLSSVGMMEDPPDIHGDSEANYTSELRETDPQPENGAMPIGSKGFDRPAGILRISATFDVTETDISRPPMFHGNLKTDGIEKVWKSILETEVPPLPPLAELADRYGDFESDKLHPVPGSVHELLRDRYWRENPVSHT